MTHVDLVAERSVGAILELTLVVCGVADSQASQGCAEVPLGRTIIQTETPTSTWKHTYVTQGLVTFMLTTMVKDQKLRLLVSLLINVTLSSKGAGIILGNVLY